MTFENGFRRFLRSPATSLRALGLDVGTQPAGAKVRIR